MMPIMRYNLRSIKENVDLREHIAREVVLRPYTSQDMVGLCPFHSESTPSFYVNQQRFKCFGCDARGDVFDWYARKGMSTAMVVSMLGGGATMPSSEPREVSNFSEFDAGARWRIIQVNAVAQRLFAERHFKGEAVQYMESRGFPEAFCRQMGVGFAPEGYNTLVRSGLKLEYLAEAGLVVERPDGTYYDRYRNRVTIPLRTASGHIVGFVGRALPGCPPEAPKYLNPKTNAAWSRDRYVMGLDTARSALGANVVEGPMDYLRCVANDILAVATLGAHVSEGQARIFEYHFPSEWVDMLYDADDAGYLGAVDALLSGVARRARFYPGLDPDDAILAGLTPEPRMDKNFQPYLFSPFLSTMKYDTIHLVTLSERFAKANIADGFPQYNFLDWVCAKHPEFAPDIKAAWQAMVDDCDEVDGKKVLKPERVQQVLKAWAKPCRAIRKKHADKFKS